MSQKPSIFLNPNFRNPVPIHINPNFVQISSNNSVKTMANKIHVNPMFLKQNQSSAPVLAPLQVSAQQHSTQPVVEVNRIIKNTRRSLIRAPAVVPRSNSVPSQKPSMEPNPALLPQSQFIKLGKNKIVKAEHLMQRQRKENEINKNATEAIIKSKKLQRKTENKESIYKLDRRQSPLKKKKKIVSTYSIRRVSPKKAIAADMNLLMG